MKNDNRVTAMARTKPKIAMAAGRLARKTGAIPSQTHGSVSTALSHAARPSRSRMRKTQLARSVTGSENR